MKGQGQLVLRYEALFSGVARLRTESGLSAAVYTQLTDVFLQQLVVYLTHPRRDAGSVSRWMAASRRLSHFGTRDRMR